MSIPTIEAVLNQIHTVLPEIIELRHDIHAHPELGFEETETAGRVVQALSGLEGIRLESGIAQTGVVATLGAGKPGPCVALRADMDCLPMEDTSGKPWASRKPGLAHACGHDGHTAALVGAAKVLSTFQDSLDGPVKFIFQPAEERLGGGRHMVEEGALENPGVAAIFGLHGWPSLPLGTVGYRHGPMMASSDSLKITIRGKGTHGALPHLGVDPILVASQVVQALQSIVSRSTDPLDSAVVTIGKIESGGTYNVIADEAVLLGTIRALNTPTRERLHREVKQIATGICNALRAEAEIVVGQGYPITVNHPRAVHYFQSLFENRLRDQLDLVETPAVMGGEDFSFYGQVIPSNFAFIGVGQEGGPPPALLHQSHYDFPDEGLLPAIQTHVEVALGFPRNGLT